MASSLAQPKLTSQGQQVLKLLQVKYGMTQANAIKLMQDGGALLATALFPLLRGTP